MELLRRDGLEALMVEEDNLVTEILGQLEDMGGKDDNGVLFGITYQLLKLQGCHWIKGGQGFIQKEDRGLDHQGQEHLDLVLHTMRKVLEQAVLILFLYTNQSEPVLWLSSILNLFPVDIHVKTDKFIGRHKGRQLRIGLSKANFRIVVVAGLILF